MSDFCSTGRHCSQADQGNPRTQACCQAANRGVPVMQLPATEPVEQVRATVRQRDLPQACPCSAVCADAPPGVWQPAVMLTGRHPNAVTPDTCETARHALATPGTCFSASESTPMPQQSMHFALHGCSAGCMLVPHEQWPHQLGAPRHLLAPAWKANSDSTPVPQPTSSTTLPAIAAVFAWMARR